MKHFTILTVLLFALLSPLAAGYGPSSPVHEATPTTFKELVTKSNKPVMVKFYAPWCGHCQRLAPEYEKAADAVGGLVQFVAVNCDEEENRALASTYEIRGFPTLKIFYPGKKKPQDYNGPRSAKAMAKALLGALGSASIQVNEENINSFLNPRGEEPVQSKVILFTEKSETPNLFKALSLDFKGRLKFGEVRKQAMGLVERFEITAFPTVLVVKQGDPTQVETYTGETKYFKLKKFLEPFALPFEEKSKEKGKPKKQRKQPEEDNGEEIPQPTELWPAEPPPIMEIDNRETLNEHCAAKGGSTLCVIAIFAPEAEEGEGVLQEDLYLPILKDVQLAMHTKKLFHFAWINGPAHKEFMDTLAIPEIYPGLVVISPKKKRAALFVGAFQKDPIVSFLGSVLSGGTRTFPFSDFPEMSPRMTTQETTTKDEL